MKKSDVFTSFLVTMQKSLFAFGREENHAQASFSGWRSQWFLLSRGRFAKKSDVFTSFLVTMQKSGL